MRRYFAIPPAQSTDSESGAENRKQLPQMNCGSCFCVVLLENDTDQTARALVDDALKRFL